MVQRKQKTQPTRRARQPQDRQERRDLILSCAKKLFQSQTLNSISMDQLAQKAQLAKGTLYLYFKTKEEVFLQLLLQELRLWQQGLTQSFIYPPKNPLLASEFTQRLLASFQASPELPRLLSHLHLVLEHNISVPTARAFKEELKNIMQQIAEVLCNQTKGLNQQTSFPFLLQLHALTIGLYQAAHPKAEIQEILKDPELAPLQISFLPTLETTLLLLLKGLEAQEFEKNRTFHFHQNY